MSETESKTSQISEEVPKFLKLRGERLNTAITSLCGVGFFLFGYDQGVM